MKLTVINVLHTVDEGFDAGPLESSTIANWRPSPGRCR
jgi:hypothetical protein